jgi:hypothetical protein
MIWILAVLIMASVSLAGWRQGAIRAAFSFVGIIFAALLAVPLGHLFRSLMPHLFSNPVTAWALAPVFGFILASIPLKVAANYVHHRVEHFYKYHAGELREALWLRLNSRLGICVGLMNGVAYFVLVSFFVFNIAYFTTQVSANGVQQPLPVRLINSLGEGMQSTGFSRTASAVGSLPAVNYQLGDLSGLLMQNPQLGPRLADYPPFISWWHRDEMQPLVTDVTLTNALASQASLGDILHSPGAQGLLANKDLTKTLWTLVATNLDDLTNYLQTGKSAKFSGEKIVGTWSFNAPVTLAWLRQDQPRLPARDIAGIRALWAAAYAQTTLLLTVDNQVFVSNWPKFIAQPPQGQPPFEMIGGKGDWSRDGNTYTLHVTVNGDEKYLVATTDGLRLTLRDGRNQLIFNHAD